MIGLVLSMINARRAQAVTLFLLATVAVAAAVAGPVSSRATDAAVVRLEVANATHRERAISVVMFTDPTSPEESGQIDAVAGFVALPGFTVVRGGEVAAFGPSADPARVTDLAGTRLVFRDGICDHVAIIDGRCLAGPREIIIGEQTASRTGLGPGDVATMQAMVYDDKGPVPDGAPASLTVVGVYTPLQPDEPYWGGQQYFPVTASGAREDAVFLTAGAMALIDHTVGTTYVDALAPPATLTEQRLDGLADEIGDVLSSLGEIPFTAIDSELPALAERVATSRELARQLGPVAFIPLAGISFFVIYLAVAYGIFGRRRELGLVALRGVSTPRRWLLATGETVLAIVLGVPVGYVLGHVGVGLLASLWLGSSEGTELSLASLPYAAGALVIAVGVALLGQRRAIAEPVVELLRGVPRTRGVWTTIVAEALVVALAVVAILQLRTNQGISGLGLLVPGLVVVAVALLAARANAVVTGLAARFALRRGLVGLGLSAVQLARRPGNQRLFALLAMGAAMLAFVAAGVDVAAQAREDRATVELGAPRVLHVGTADPRRLLAATAEADPEGEWAMAAVVVEPSRPNDPTLLAVDTSRLATVATWRPEFGVDPQQVAAEIAPLDMTPMELTSGRIEVDVEVFTRPAAPGFPQPEFTPAQLELEFITLDTATRVSAQLNNLVEGRATVAAAVPRCVRGCRFIGFRAPDLQFTTQLLLHGVRQLEPDAQVVGPAELSDRKRWRATDNATVVPAGNALSVRLQPRQLADTDVRVSVVNAEIPVPVAAFADRNVPRITSLDGGFVESREALSLSVLPRLGHDGALVDLRYLERTLLGSPIIRPAEIWLGPAAPADAADRFRALGLGVMDETTQEQVRTVLARQGPALALHFHWAAAALGVVLAIGGLGLVAAIDRRQRASDLRALRVQGLPRRMVRRATLWGYLSTVVLASLTGLGGAAVAWAAAGDRIPIFTDPGSGLVPPRWPLWLAVVEPWAVATGVMVVAAVVAAWALRRAVRSGGNGGGV